MGLASSLLFSSLLFSSLLTILFSGIERTCWGLGYQGSGHGWSMGGWGLRCVVWDEDGWGWMGIDGDEDG